MKAARIHSFGSPAVVVVEDIPVPSPGRGEILVSVMAAGVAPWDAIIREGKSKVSPQPPLTLGSDLAGVVEKVGPGITNFAPGDEVYGVTNPQFCGAQAEFAVATAGMVARKPRSLNFLEAASAPVIAVTAWQMLFQYAQATRGQTVMIVGAARQDRPRDRPPAAVTIRAPEFVVPKEASRPLAQARQLTRPQLTRNRRMKDPWQNDHLSNLPANQ